MKAVFLPQVVLRRDAVESLLIKLVAWLNFPLEIFENLAHGEDQVFRICIGQIEEPL